MAVQNVNPMVGTVTTKARLNVRGGAPSLSAPVVARLEIGSQVPIRGITTGDAVNKDPRWYVGLNDTFLWAGACNAPTAVADTPATIAAGALSGRVERAPPGAKGFDINSPLTAASAKSYVKQGFVFCVRYIRRDPVSANDLTRTEVETILSAGLALMAVQHVTPHPWVASESLGTTYGENAAAAASAAGLPPGMNIWLDLEDVRADTPASDVIAYCNAWFAAAEAKGYVPGVYVGSNTQLSGDDLYWRLKTKHYWKSGSTVPPIPERGYQMIQHIPAGPDTDTSIDLDVTRNDAFGDAVLWFTRT